jgi:hypothetical protein
VWVWNPTAVHAVVEGHETPCSWLGYGYGEGARAGVAWIDHFLPFHRSATAPVGASPTAVHAVAEAHETDISVVWSGAGVSWSDHLFPFQRSANAWVPPTLSPTAMHAIVELHDTAFSSPFGTAPGFAA